MIFFDITTTATWHGTSVGISRVENELAKGILNAKLGRTGYCVYDLKSNRYYKLRDKSARSLLNGEITISLEDISKFSEFISEQKYSNKSDTIKRSLPNKEDVAGVLSSLNEYTSVKDNNNNWKILHLSEIFEKEIKLSDSLTIINAGLDWDNKNIRAIRLLKQRYKFKYVAVLYDLIPIYTPQYLVPGYDQKLKRYFGELFWVADTVACISQTTLDDAKNYIKFHKLTAPKFFYWNLGADLVANDSPQDQSTWGEPDYPFALYVSTIEPRKNHRTLVNAFYRAILEERVPKNAKLIFVGRQGWCTSDLLTEISMNPTVRDRIVIMSGLSDRELDTLYKLARFVMFPSYYEGYGLSLAEALHHNKACLCSDRGSLKEVGLKAPIYLDPDDTLAWAKNISELFSDDDKIRKLEDAAKRSKRPTTWKQSSVEFYSKLKNTL